MAQSASYEKLVAEFLGTFAVVFASSGAAMSYASFGTLEIALAFGGAILAATLALHAVSGAHLNPAVTFANVIVRRMSGKEAFGYFVSQLLGSVLAALLLASALPAVAARTSFGLAVLPTSAWEGAVLLEAVATFVIVLTWLSLFRKSSVELGLGVFGASVFAALVAGPFTGGLANPARAFGPALVSSYWATQSVYWFGAAVGALVATVAYEYVVRAKRESGLRV